MSKFREYLEQVNGNRELLIVKELKKYNIDFESNYDLKYGIELISNKSTRSENAYAKLFITTKELKGFLNTKKPFLDLEDEQFCDDSEDECVNETFSISREAILELFQK